MHVNHHALRYALTGLLALTACATEEELAPEPGLISEPVVGGKATDACDWPSTVDVNGCTGTLIHHRVVTTAAHCLSGANGKVTFTAGKGTSGAFTIMGTCKAGARGSSGGGTSRDWAYCVIPEDERVKKFQITPPLVGCEAEKFLKVGASGWVVGFGTTGPQGDGYGIKRAVEVKINKIGNGTIDIGDKNVGACHGDSGGPIYMKLGDATHDWGYRVFGSTSSAGGNCDCTCSTLFVNISMHVKAIEENEKIDVTPCTDASGAWAPGPECRGFQSKPQDGTGTYPTCSVAPTLDPIETCGPTTVMPAAGGGAPPLAGAGAPAAAGGAAPGSAGRSAVPGAGSGALPVAGAPAAAAAGGGAVIGAGRGTVGAAAGRPALGGAPAPAGAPGAAVGAPIGTAGRNTGTIVGAVGVGGAPAAGAAATLPGIVATQPPAPPPAKSGGCQVLASSARDDGAAIAWLAVFGLAGVCIRRARPRRA